MKLKKLLASFMAACMVATAVPVTAMADDRIDTAEELQVALEAAGAAGAGNTTIEIAGDINMEGVEWKPVYVDGYHGADVVTVNGNNHTITNLTAPLFAGGFAGGSGIVIKDLTIANSEIVSTNTTGSGAFVEAADSMTEITLKNCHLKDSTVTGVDRTGGLIGWTSGYSKQDDGPVKSYITVENCSVIGCEIIGGGSVGAINGHAGASDWTYTTIEDCTVESVKLTSNDDGGWRVGVVIGTANAGEVEINNITYDDIEMTQGAAPIDGQTDLVGRFVAGNTGKLTIDGKVYTTECKPEAPKGTITPGYTSQTGIWGEGKSNATESYVVKLYLDDTEIASASLNDVGNIIDGTYKNVTWSIPFAGSNDKYWDVKWEEGYPNKEAQPTTVALFVDGVEVATNNVQMNGPDNLNKIEGGWEGLDIFKPVDERYEGTKEEPYLINNVNDLIWLQKKVDEQSSDGSTQFAGKYFKLTADIDLAGIDWNPIGSMSGDHGSFKGVFDGNGHTISNLNVQTAGNGIGLFARTAGNAEIKNLNLHNVTVKSTDNSNYVGGVVGNAYASTKITNVHVTGNIDISGRGYIGGIAGHGYVVMDNVSVKGKGTISSTFWCAGGILGYGGEGATNIMNASVEGLTIRSAAGGLGSIVGMAEDNNGTQPIAGSNLSAKDVLIQTYEGAYGTSYAEYAIGYLYGGNDTTIFTGNISIDNVEIECSNGNTSPAVSDFVVRIGTTYYKSLEDAFKAAKSGDTVTIIADGTYALSTSGKDLTIKAADGVEATFDNIGAKNMGGANVTFENVTFDYYPNVNYTGLQHSGNLVYNNCTINGQVFLYGESEVFNECTFNQNSADAYNVWTYGADYVKFNECTFNCAGKSVLVYNEGAGPTELVVNDTDFIANNAVDGKAAIEIDTKTAEVAMTGTSITIDAETTATGFDVGSVSGNSLWNDKKDMTNLAVYVAGVQVWPIAEENKDAVAAIGDNYYATLAAAVAAAAEDAEIVLLKDSAETITVSREVEFTLVTNGNDFTGSIEAGAGYDCDVNGNKYTFTETSSSTPSTSSNRKSSKKYSVEIEDMEDGTVKASSTSAKKGATVTLTVTPDDGYELDELVVLDSDGEEVELKDKGNGKYTFVMPRGGVEIEASFEEADEADEPVVDESTVDEKDENVLILTINQVIYQLNGSYEVNDVAPIIKGDRTMLPIRLIAEFLGASVTWNEAEQSVTIVNGDTTIVIYIGQAFALVNGSPVQLDAPAFIENDRTYLPVRFIAENLGATVTWDGAAQTVTIVG